ncbi:MAG: sulfatase-like hydrolase/transferase, partial [Planctomycetota bacterium]
MRPLLPLVLVCLAACGGRERNVGPNLLLISLDSVRADALGVYGARLASGESPTPNLDALAAGGLVYREARATTSWTLPSHTALFTGVPELAHAVEQ